MKSTKEPRTCNKTSQEAARKVGGKSTEDNALYAVSHLLPTSRVFKNFPAVTFWPTDTAE